MGEFPALPAPSTDGVRPLKIEAFLEALHGAASAGPVAPDGDLARCAPRLLAVDCRSPSEFATGHIPGAVSIPLFSDDARAVVGTTYAQKGRYEAIKAGLAETGARFAGLLEALEGHGAKPGHKVLVYCWRGGMRSGSVAWLFSLCGFQVCTLEGGYRSYRRWCKTVVGNEHVRAPAPVMVLGGCTGVGKTAILHELRAAGEQVLDLEGLANHRGSAFGSMGQPPQPTNESYENVLALAVRRVKPDRPLWVEHEGAHVGKVLVPFGVAAWVRAAPGGAMVVVQMERPLRVQRLVEDYCSEENLKVDNWVAHLKECISAGLAKKLGGGRVKEALQMLDEGKWSQVADMMLDYYDKLYVRWESQTESAHVVKVDCPTVDAADNATRVLRAASISSDALREGTEGCNQSMDVAKTGDIQVVDSATGDQQGEAAPEPSQQPRYAGACHCGEVRVACVGEPRSVSYCHCSICRRLSGAPFSCQAVFAGEQVQLSLEPGASLQSTQTSRGVDRSRCASCLAPVRATLLGGKLAAVPLGLIATWRGGEVASGGDELRPVHHMYYKDRVMDVRDGLPKYDGAVRPGPGKASSGLLPEADW